MRHCLWLRQAAASAVQRSGSGAQKPPTTFTKPDKHYQLWGKAFILENLKRVGPPKMFQNAIAAQQQIQGLAERWNTDAKIFLCGSLVTYGQMEWGSDLDLACLFDDPLPPHDVQGKRCEKLWYNLKRYMPAHLRPHFLAIADARTPVCKLRSANDEKVGPMRYKELTEEEDRRSRTALLDISGKSLSDQDMQYVADRMGRDRVEGAWAGKTPEGGSKVAIQMTTRQDAIDCLGFFPDGRILTAKQRGDLVRGVLDQCFLPEMFIFKWDISFVGYGVKN